MSISDPTTRVKANANGHSRVRDNDFLDDPDGSFDDDYASSWTVVDMAASLSSEPILPALGARDDGERLIYRGKVHWVFGTYETGKTWLCLYLVAQVLNDDGTAMYVDFEDNARTIGSRLLQLGVPESVLKDPARFAYIRPDVSLRSERERITFDNSLSRRFDVAVIDGVTEAIALEGLKDNSGGDVAVWQALLPRRIAHQTGAAVLCIDHVPKDQDNRVMPIGSQHKMNGLDGAAFKVLRHEPFGRGLVGKAWVRVNKDRHGGVRAFGVKYDPTDNSHLVGQFVLDATDSTAYKSFIAVPGESTHSIRAVDTKPSVTERRTWCMERISTHLELELNDHARSQRQIVDHMHKHVKGKGGRPISMDTWRSALKSLLAENYAYTIAGAKNSALHFISEPFRQGEESDAERRKVAVRHAQAKKLLARTGGETND
jgi:hypothetical protein